MPKFQRAMPVACVTRPKAAPATRAAPAACLTRRAPPPKNFFANRVRHATYRDRSPPAPARFRYHVTRCKQSRKPKPYA